MFELQPDEQLVLTIRKHWLVFILENLWILVAVVLPFIILAIYQSQIDHFFVSMTSKQVGALITFFLAGWELMLLAVFFVSLTNYYLDILFVTDKRLIDVDQAGLFARDIATAPLENIQDVKTEVFGILATLFGFGTLQIETAGATKIIVVQGLKHPQRAKEAILTFYEKRAPFAPKKL